MANASVIHPPPSLLFEILHTTGATCAAVGSLRGNAYEYLDTHIFLCHVHELEDNVSMGVAGFTYLQGLSCCLTDA